MGEVALASSDQFNKNRDMLKAIRDGVTPQKEHENIPNQPTDCDGNKVGVRTYTPHTHTHTLLAICCHA